MLHRVVMHTYMQNIPKTISRHVANEDKLKPEKTVLGVFCLHGPRTSLEASAPHHQQQQHLSVKQIQKMPVIIVRSEQQCKLSSFNQNSHADWTVVTMVKGQILGMPRSIRPVLP